MPKNDVVVRNAQDLERKYNFASLLGLKKNVEITNKGLQKIENELSNMLNAFTINLKNVLDSQSEVSLWFYSGIPTFENEPYINWSEPDSHIGDIYYDKSSGIVYQYNNIWEVNPSPDLIEAMAITNSEIDTTEDHERKVFFSTPIIPYSNGDWYIKEDGSLYICQISKTSGEYEEQDFILANNYTESIAQKIGDAIEVLKGTVTILSDNYAKFTDLATGGSTIIAGENIMTGTISAERISGLGQLQITLESVRNNVDNTTNELNTYKSQNDENIENVFTQIHDNQQQLIDFQNNIEQYGVNSLQNPNFLFDYTGMHTIRPGAEAKSTLNETGIYVDDSSGNNKLTANSNGVITDNLMVRTYLIQDPIRKEQIIRDSEARLAAFYLKL